MNILVCGFGKIGTIKASIWSRLGASVYIYDIRDEACIAARKWGYRASPRLDEIAAQCTTEPYIVDVSTPAGLHGAMLADVLLSAKTLPASVLLEKPLASSQVELDRLIKLIDQQLDRQKIFVNESYYASAALAKFNKLLEQKRPSSSIKSVYVLFQKNRVPDVKAGRFTDPKLGAFGIEVSHMLACLRAIGINQFSVDKNVYYTHVGGELYSEGTLSFLHTNTTEIVLAQSLGAFVFDKEHTYTVAPAQPSIKRLVEVMFAGGDLYTLQFDPLPDHPRYHSRLTVVEKNKKVVDTILPDNHLEALLRTILNYAQAEAKPSRRRFPNFDSLIEDAKKLLVLRQSAKTHTFKLRPPEQ